MNSLCIVHRPLSNTFKKHKSIWSIWLMYIKFLAFSRLLQIRGFYSHTFVYMIIINHVAVYRSPHLYRSRY